ncbi:MAG: YihY family inner membrane protein [Alphaproteobacteria bacterium]|jgi:membrane protein|nr:YihY family inner membrane protein [Alphaproteobacteria bacterium]
MRLPGLTALWKRLLARTARLRAWVRDIASFVRLAGKRFWDDQCTQAASALAYTSLLALVPLMTVMIGILSAFPAFADVRDRAQALIFNSLVPQVGEAVLDRVETFSERAGSLTGVGVVGLIVTSVLLLSTIEGAFNAIWRVRSERSIVVRILSFWAILTMTPILVAASISATTRFLAGADLDAAHPVWGTLLGLVPLLVQFVGFWLLYWLIPNCPVRMVDAMIGGATTAILFEGAKNGFALYVTYFPTYETIYGALAAIPIFLVWLYLAWSIILLGAVVAATFPDWRTGKLLGTASARAMRPSQRLTLALAVLREMCKAARQGNVLSRKALLRRLPVSAPMLDDTLEVLRRHHYAVRTADDGWVVARDLRAATVLDLARVVDLGLAEPESARLEPFGKLQGAWLDRVEAALCSLRDDQTDRLSLPLADLLAGPVDGPAHHDAAQPTVPAAASSTSKT